MTAAPAGDLVLPADQLYGRLLARAARHSRGSGPSPRARIRTADGRVAPLPLARWLAPADATDRMLVATLAAPVLDLGCGPGRHVEALIGLGKRALGIDRSAVAVGIARARGADAIPGSLWGELPGPAAWRTVLLLDGNIGIGGAPLALLRRAKALLAPGGLVVVETDPAGTPTECLRVRIEAGAAVSEWFPWARVGACAIEPLAAAAGLAVDETRTIAERSFAMLRAA